MPRFFAHSTNAAQAPGPQAFKFLAAVAMIFLASRAKAASMKYLSLTLCAHSMAWVVMPIGVKPYRGP